MSKAPSRPTGVRHLIVLLLTLMSVLLYLDRFCVSFAVDYIKEDLALSQTQVSWFLSLFFWSYALSQVPAGWLADRFGARLMLSIYVVAWSLFTAQMGLVAGFAMLLFARLMCGITQAGAYPTAGGVISRWIPLSKRATASAWVGIGGRMGGAMAPVLTAYLMVVFVPVNKPVDFTANDILDPGRFCARIVPFSDTVIRSVEPESFNKVLKLMTKPSSPTDRFGTLFQETTAVADWSEIESVAEEYRLWQIHKRIHDEKAPLPKTTPQTVTLLVLGLNRRLNGEEQSPIYDPAEFPKINLPREAVDYAQRTKNGERLSDNELRRFNRLLIEAAFPGEIRKLYGRGWRPVMIVYGLSGVIVALAIWLVFRNRPEEHSGVNADERAVIEAGRLATAADTASKAGRLPIKPLLTNFSLWCNCANQVGTNIGWVFLVTWLSRYFIEMHNVPILERGVMVMMPNLIGLCGGFLGGRWVDWLLPRIGLKWSRSLPPIITRFIAAGGYGMCLYFASQPVGSTLNSPWAFTAAFCLIYFSVDLGQSAFWAYAQDAGGKYVGSVLGWGNMWGNLGAAFGPLLYNYLLGENPSAAEWNNLFWLGLIAFVFAGIATFGLDASKPVFARDEVSAP